MPYAHTTYAKLRQDLANRLDDSGKVYWIDDELKVIITEALRTFGFASAFWRERGTLNTVANTAFYDIPSNSSLLSYSVTDYDIIKSLQYHLLEKATSQAVWPGTEMFTLDDLSSSIQRRINQFLQDTGIVVTRTTSPQPPPPVGRVDLLDNIIDIRRLAWLDTNSRYYHLWREDELALEFFDNSWPINPNVPYAYSVLVTRPLEIQIAPPPMVSGTLEILSVNTHTNLNPATGATVLSLFDDITWIIKWGALADVLGKDGPARDPQRANFCEQRYQQGVQLTRLLSAVLNARINDVPVRPSTLYDLDAGVLNWQNKTGPPVDLGLAGWNLLAVRPVPDGIYSITLDVTRKAPIPVNDNDQVQIGREQIDSLLDYSEHLAMFKVGGAEFEATVRQANNFLMEAVSFNSRLSASARYIFTAKTQSQEENKPRPRKFRGPGLGTVPEEVNA